LKQRQNYDSRNYNYRRNRRRYSDPYETYFVLAAVLTILLTAGLLFLKFPVYLAYLAGINSVTFCFYGFDKFQAKREGGRIPEKILHMVAILGGAPGGIAGQWIFHHKIRKQIFHIILWASLLVHLIIFLVFFRVLLTANFNGVGNALKSVADWFNKTFNRR
jgi:uncharacterized membrane protein YsdA (DUF1294 family)